MIYRAEPESMEMGIIRELEKLKIYDCHEHLPSEKERLASSPDAFTLFSHYCQHDLYSGGLDKPRMAEILWKPGDIDEKWRDFKPYYEKAKDTCYFRAAHIILEKFYGETELTDQNYRRVSELVAAENREGLYARRLKDACGIEKLINCDGVWTDTEGGLFAQTVWMAGGANRAELEDFFGCVPPCAADAVQKARDRLDEAKKAGCVGMKMFIFDTEPVSEADAAAAYNEILTSAEGVAPDNAFNRYMMLEQMLYADKIGLSCCIHTGYWNDYRKLNPSGLLPFIQKHHFHRVDLYHVGYPYVREAIMLGKVWPGVHLNMAWTYLISRRFAHDTLDEMLEMLPDNKIFGFGGDYYEVEKVYGHLCMARECIASVLAEKIRRREMSLERALSHGEKMLRDNPKNFYGF